MSRTAQKTWQLNLANVSLISIALLIPCFWQSRMQAGDLSSHIYNAWLTIQVQRGLVSGFWIAHQYTNIALDLLLSWLLPHTGLYAAQHIAIPFFVLIFFWGVVRFTREIAGSVTWPIIAFTALLSYGFVFHLGLFNFYFSTGVCCWFLGLTWDAGLKRTLIALPLLLVAWAGNPLPVLWAIGLLFYKALAEKISSRVIFVACALFAIVARFVVSDIYLSQWNSSQLSLITGADQLFLYGKRYAVVMILLLLIWAGMLRKLIRENGLRPLLADITTQIYSLTVLIVGLLPDAVLFNLHQAPATFLAERLSLFCGILFCAVVAKTSLSIRNQTFLAMTVALFFLFCYQDEHKLNIVEDQISARVQQMSPTDRVIFVPSQQVSSRMPAPAHIIDRACIEHCFSYANYEPTSGHFRLRAEPNTLMGDYWTLQSLQREKYFVKTRDLPLHQVVPSEDGKTYKIVQLYEDQRITDSDVIGPN